MVRGRDRFSQFERLFTVAEALVGALPRGLRGMLLSIVRDMPGQSGIGVRYVLLRCSAMSCGRTVAVFETVFLRNIHKIEFGNNVSIHPMCYIEGEGGLHIGSDVSIAHGVTIMTTEHDYAQPGTTIRDVPVKSAKVVIGNDVWIGAGAKILAGVSIGNHVAIGAGAVVTRDIPSNSVAVGVPARVIKELDARR